MGALADEDIQISLQLQFAERILAGVQTSLSRDTAGMNRAQQAADRADQNVQNLNERIQSLQNDFDNCRQQNPDPSSDDNNGGDTGDSGTDDGQDGQDNGNGEGDSGNGDTGGDSGGDSGTGGSGSGGDGGEGGGEDGGDGGGDAGGDCTEELLVATHARVQAQAAAEEFRRVLVLRTKARKAQGNARRAVTALNTRIKGLQRQRKSFERRRASSQTYFETTKKAITDVVGGTSFEQVLALRPRIQRDPAAKRLAAYGNAITLFARFSDAKFNTDRIERQLQDIAASAERLKTELTATSRRVARNRRSVISISRHLDKHMQRAVEVIKDDGDASGGLGDCLGLGGDEFSDE